MNRFGLTSLLVVFLLSFVGCSSGTYTMATLYQQEAGNGYCHKKLQPIGPSDPGRPAEIGGGDFIDYYGPCDGPSMRRAASVRARMKMTFGLLQRPSTDTDFQRVTPLKLEDWT